MAARSSIRRVVAQLSDYKSGAASVLIQKEDILNSLDQLMKSGKGKQ
jgi:hypothetical protein